MHIWSDNPSSPSIAIVHYWIDMKGGARWAFDDQGLVLQAYKREKNTWKLVHHIDATGTDYDPDNKKTYNDKGLQFEYVYPVKDLKRAVAFYKPILGEPDYTTNTVAYFGLKDPGFYLDSSGLFGLSGVKENKTNGYAIVKVKNLNAEVERLKKKGVTFLARTDKTPAKFANNNIAIIADEDGNVIVLLENVYHHQGGRPSVTGGFMDKNSFDSSSKKIALAWMQKDTTTLGGLLGKNGLWFDNSKISYAGIQKGKAQLINTLQNDYWKQYEQNDAGISGEWKAENTKEIKLGPYTIVSYERIFRAASENPKKSRSFVTHIFESPGMVEFTLINNATDSKSMAIDLDYTAHPVKDIKKAAEFYTRTMEWGKPYKDESWRGYWSDHSVYGLFEVEDNEKLLIPEKTNGYVSFSVSSAEKTYSYLKKQKVYFPLTPSINRKKGIDHEPGYIQVVACDSEGNIVVFTEYTGKKERTKKNRSPDK